MTEILTKYEKFRESEIKSSRKYALKNGIVRGKTKQRDIYFQTKYFDKKYQSLDDFLFLNEADKQALTLYYLENNTHQESAEQWINEKGKKGIASYLFKAKISEAIAKLDTFLFCTYGPEKLIEREALAERKVKELLLKELN